MNTTIATVAAAEMLTDRMNLLIRASAGEIAKLKPYDFLSHRFPLCFVLLQPISAVNVYAGLKQGDD